MSAPECAECGGEGERETASEARPTTQTISTIRDPEPGVDQRSAAAQAVALVHQFCPNRA